MVESPGWEADEEGVENGVDVDASFDSGSFGRYEFSPADLWFFGEMVVFFEFEVLDRRVAGVVVYQGRVTFPAIMPLFLFFYLDFKTLLEDLETLLSRFTAGVQNCGDGRNRGEPWSLCVS